VRDRGWTIFVTTIYLIAAGFFIYFFGTDQTYLDPTELGLVILLTSLLLLLSFGTTVGSGSGTHSSITLPIIIPALYLLGPFWGGFVSAIGTIQPNQIKKGFPVYIFILNRAMIFISVIISSFWLRFLVNGGFEWINIWIVAAIGFSYNLVNNIMLWAGLWADRKLSSGNNFILFALERTRTVFISTLVAVIFIIVYQSHALPGILILFALVFLFRDVLQARFKHINSFFQVIESFARVIDTKDPYTRGHSERVAQYVEDIGRRAGLSPIRIPRIVQAAKLHDVGKLGIPEAILLKPGRLTAQEYDQIKSHPVRGEKLLEDIEMLDDLMAIIRHHHERYDGKGYPDGRKGEDIPFEARILSLADAFDCMTTDRIYRKAMNKEEVLEELERCSGTQFDPHLTRILIDMLQNDFYDENFGWQK